MTNYSRDYFDRLLRRGPYNPRVLADGQLQADIRAARQAERVAPTVDDADELMEVSERAKDELVSRYPLQEAR